MSIEAMKQALEALEHESNRGNDNAYQRERDALRAAISEAEKQEPVALEWDEVFDAAAATYCRSEASRKALRLCFQSRDQTTQISIGWTAKELMAFAKTLAYICTTPPAAQRKPLTDEQIDAVCAPLGFAQLSPREVARAIEAAHGITGEKT